MRPIPPPAAGFPPGLLAGTDGHPPRLPAKMRRHVGIESSVGNSQRKLLLLSGSLCQSADATANGKRADGSDDDDWRSSHVSALATRTL